MSFKPQISISLHAIDKAPSSLKILNEKLFKPNGLDVTDFTIEPEGQLYDACYFRINEKQILYRRAKITPIKKGQFVTLWKRNLMGITVPFDFSDEIDLVVIQVNSPSFSGQFVFPVSVLVSKGVFTSEQKKGKRALRIYPPWDIVSSKQAIQSQNWQKDYFVPLDYDNKINLTYFKELYS